VVKAFSVYYKNELKPKLKTSTFKQDAPKFIKVIRATYPYLSNEEKKIQSVDDLMTVINRNIKGLKKKNAQKNAKKIKRLKHDKAVLKKDETVAQFIADINVNQ
jgi:hypothetical protein